MRYLKLILFVFLISQGAQALNVCLHARSTNDVASGHAFVTVQNNAGRIQETYGLWPNDKLTEKYPHQVAINRPGDLPLQIMRARGYIIANDSPRLTEEAVCATLKVSVNDLREQVLNYTSEESYGPYQTMNNNCTHFAIRIFNIASQENFPVVMTPKRVKSIIVRLGQ